MLRKLVYLSSLVVSTFLGAEEFNFISPIPSRVKEISVPNTHYVGKQVGNLLRGMAPRDKVSELIDFGVTDVLIFKKASKDENKKEISEFERLSFGKIKPKEIEFLWHDFPSYKEACKKTLEALLWIKEKSSDPSRKVFFHCTVGEDRTGFLSALWLELNNKNQPRDFFKEEMCEKGYGRGNPDKPDFVVSEIQNDLSPLYFYLQSQIQSKKLSLDKLDDSICVDELPKQSLRTCTASSLFPKKIN